MDTACALVQESGSEQKWKQLAELATSQAKFELAQQCLHEAQDHGGLLLLATAAGNAEMVRKLGNTREAGAGTRTRYWSFWLIDPRSWNLFILNYRFKLHHHLPPR